MALLAELVAINSVSSEPVVGMVDAIGNRLDRPGISLERLSTGEPGKLNLVARAGPEGAVGEGLVLSGHMDVVPPGVGWSSDPFTLTAQGDRLVGRGTADMKGFLALAVGRMAALDPARLRAPVVLLLTCDEETGTRGARHLVSTWNASNTLPAAAIIGEPTSLGVVSAHKGHLRLRCTFTGVPAHSGLPHLGRNAIEPAGKAIVALAELREALEDERLPASDRFPEVPFVVLNIATVLGGTAFNVVPGQCVLELGIRTLPGGDSAALVERIRECIGTAVKQSPFTLEVAGETPAMMTHGDTPVHRWLADQRQQREVRSVSFASDGGWLAQLGLDCVLWGPGSIDVAHKPDEYLPAAEFVEAGQVLDRAIAHFAGKR